MPGPVGGGCLIRLTSGGPPDLYLPLLRVTPNTRLQPGSPASSSTEGDAIRGMPDGQAPRLPSLPQPAARPAGQQNWTGVRPALPAPRWIQPLARAAARLAGR